jgi:membrane-associated phospholipid phosphatase
VNRDTPPVLNCRLTSNHRWALVRGAATTWRRFRDAWKGLPSAALRGWIKTLVAGFLLCAALVAITTKVVQSRAVPLERWDTHWLLRIEQGPMSFSNAILLESFGNLAYMVPLTLAAAVVAARYGRPLLALSFPIAYVLQRPLVLIGWTLWNRERPKLIAGGIAAPGLHSFPSGHVALMLAVYGLLTYLWVRTSQSWVERVLAIVLLAALLLVTGWARIRLGAHWPSDVMAGYGIGAAWLAVVIVALRRAERAGGCC